MVEASRSYTTGAQSTPGLSVLMVEGHCPINNVNIVWIEQLFVISLCLCLKTMEKYSLNLRIELESVDIRCTCHM